MIPRVGCHFSHRCEHKFLEGYKMFMAEGNCLSDDLWKSHGYMGKMHMALAEANDHGSRVGCSQCMNFVRHLDRVSPGCVSK